MAYVPIPKDLNTVISNKNTVGVYDMESQVKAEKRNADE